MKKLLLIGLCLLFLSGISAQEKENEGIRFFHGAWDEVLQEAKMQNKILFVDIWASWCGPCRQMAATTFMDKEVSDYFNAHFVNYKLMTDPKDKAEREQARALAQKYHANTLPTLLWLDAEGNLLHFATGFHEVATLLAEAETAQNPEKRIGAILQRWANGDRSLEAGMAYFSFFSTASKEFDDFYLQLPVESQCDTNLQTLMLFKLRLDANSTVPSYVASRWTKQYAAAPRAALWELFLTRTLEESLKSCVDTPVDFERIAGDWRKYNLPFTETTIKKVLCVNAFEKQDYRIAYNQLAEIMKEQWGNDLFFIYSVLNVLFEQLKAGTLPEEQRLPILIEYAEHIITDLQRNDSDAYQICLLACVICGEKTKAEQYAETAICALPDDAMKQEMINYIHYLISPLE